MTPGRLGTALAVAVASGLAWAGSQPPIGVWWLVLLVVPGWLTAVHLVAGARARVAFLVGVVLTLSAFIPMIWWLAAPATPLAPIVLSLALGTYVGVASVAVQCWTRSPWVGVVGGVVWAGMEVARARWPVGGFGWADLASAHVEGSWMLTSARVLGADGLTLLTALLGSLAFAACLAAVRAWSEVEPNVGATVVPGPARVVATFDAVRPLVLGTLGVAVLGTLVTVGPPPIVGEVDVLLVQGHDGVPQLRGSAEDLRIAEQHAALTEEAVAADGVPDLTVWAENAVDGDPAVDPALGDVLARAGAATNGRLITGLTRDGTAPGTFHNSVVAVDGTGDVTATYDKIRVVPFGEYVPLRDIIGGLGPLQRVPRDAVPGVEPVTIDVHGLRVAPIICFETLFAGTVRRAVAADDAGLVVAATNDSSFGPTAESAQHVAQSRLRAVETGRAVAHVSISGQSTLIDPDGAVIAQGPLFATGTVRGTLPVVSGSTPAATVAPVVTAALASAFVLLLSYRVVMAVQRRREDAA